MIVKLRKLEALSLITGLQLDKDMQVIDYVKRVIAVCGMGTDQVPIHILRVMVQNYLKDTFKELSDLPMSDLLELGLEDKNTAADKWIKQLLDSGVVLHKNYRIKQMSQEKFNTYFLMSIQSKEGIL